MNQYQVSFGDAIKRAFTQYCVFSGRASRSEFWWFMLFTWIVGACLGLPNFYTVMDVMHSSDSYSTMVEAQSTTGIMTYISYLWGLFILLPSFGLLFRRLHDTGRSGWNWCWSFLPVVGTIILIVFCCQPSQPVDNKYGPVPNLRVKY